ncbi:leucine-rich repeat receptor-like protein CLAVATA2 [Iris pallida]|uniref:Leucine-rich repeat receptor-like protein CLAVATA2 n=1 Tax=Iris pallida TaxID=29817 RepID=A0AAX6HSM1_IRIPA|nr:leucine-rich repeat receptor-like protein CLAVATA2 [Iris pallida]
MYQISPRLNFLVRLLALDLSRTTAASSASDARQTPRSTLVDFPLDPVSDYHRRLQLCHNCIGYPP